MRVFIVLGLIAAGAASAVADPLPDAGSAKLSAYQVCRPLQALDMGAAGSESFTECNGVVKNADPQKQPDNLLIHCLEDASARPDDYKYAGACVLTDGDGDKLFMTYAGAKTGQVKLVGGVGKYQGIAGSGGLSVVVAPGGTTSLFAYTLGLDVSWTHKAK